MNLPMADKRAIYRSLDLSLKRPDQSSIDITASHDSLGSFQRHMNSDNVNLQSYEFNQTSARKIPKLREKFHSITSSQQAFVCNELVASRKDLLDETAVLEKSGPTPGILTTAQARSKHTSKKSFTYR